MARALRMFEKVFFWIHGLVEPITAPLFRPLIRWEARRRIKELTELRALVSPARINVKPIDDAIAAWTMRL